MDDRKYAWLVLGKVALRVLAMGVLVYTAGAALVAFFTLVAFLWEEVVVGSYSLSFWFSFGTLIMAGGSMILFLFCTREALALVPGVFPKPLFEKPTDDAHREEYQRNK